MSEKSKVSRETIRKIAMGSLLAATVLGGAYFYYQYRTAQCQDSSPKNANSCGSCCGSSAPVSTKEEKNIKSIVNDRYSATARNFNSRQQTSANNIAKVFGYTDEQLKEFGSDANMGLGCGNPVANASIKPGEVVMDLGSGGGFDCFLALKKVGKGGKVIGIDMSQDMINKATKLAKKRGYNCVDINDIEDEKAQVSFYLTEIENMELISDNYVNCIISNCVLNLVPNKLNAFKEIYRVLKRNNEGRLAISDIAMKKEFPKELNEDARTFIAGYVNCISGAILVKEYERLLRLAGFKEIKFIEKKVDLNVWKGGWESGGKSGGCCGSKDEDDGGCCAPIVNNNNNDSGCCGDDGNSEAKPGIDFTEEECDSIKKNLKDIDLNEYIGSYYVFALK